MFQIHVKHCRLEYISIAMIIIIKKINSDQIYLVNLGSEHEIVCFMNNSVYESFFLRIIQQLLTYLLRQTSVLNNSCPRARDHSMLSNICLLEWFVE